jgi:hypothetical protein
LAVSDYVLEEEAREYVNSVRIDDDPVDKYSLPEQQEQQDFETEIVVDETPVVETPASFQSAVNLGQDFPTAAPEEPLEEPQKKTYASIVGIYSLLVFVSCFVLHAHLHLCGF